MHFIEEAEVTEALATAELDWALFGIVWDETTEMIRRDPMCGLCLNEDIQVRLLENPGSYAVQRPTVFLLYRIELDVVVFMNVEFRAASYPFHGSA